MASNLPEDRDVGADLFHLQVAEDAVMKVWLDGLEQRRKAIEATARRTLEDSLECLVRLRHTDVVGCLFQYDVSSNSVTRVIGITAVYARYVVGEHCRMGDALRHEYTVHDGQIEWGSHKLVRT